MKIRELCIPGAFEATPRQFGDERGVFLEWFRTDVFAGQTGHPLTLAQANCSISRRGTLRGVHFADVPPGQAKYVTCLAGAVLDVVVDIRVGSPTYGEHDSVLLDDQDRRAIYLAEGLGHAFIALADNSAVSYLCSTPFAPDREHGVDPLDPALALPWPSDIEALLSTKDAQAPTLAAAKEAGLLPSYDECVAFVESLSGALR